MRVSSSKKDLAGAAAEVGERGAEGLTEGGALGAVATDVAGVDAGEAAPGEQERAVQAVGVGDEGPAEGGGERPHEGAGEDGEGQGAVEGCGALWAHLAPPCGPPPSWASGIEASKESASA